MALIEILPDQMWHATQAVRFGPVSVDTRMTIVRLPDRSLWVHSPIHPDNELAAAIRARGNVAHVVAPNRSHHLHFIDFLEAFPGARGFVPPGVGDKRPDLAGYPAISPCDMPWSEALEGVFIAGLPMLNETAWYHPSSGTLILSDLLFFIGAGKSLLPRTLARMLGVHKRLAMSRTMRMLVKDKAAFAQSIAALRDYDIRRVIVAHDQIVETNAASQFAAAFRWLAP